MDFLCKNSDKPWLFARADSTIMSFGTLLWNELPGDLCSLSSSVIYAFRQKLRVFFFFFFFCKTPDPPFVRPLIFCHFVRLISLKKKILIKKLDRQNTSSVSKSLLVTHSWTSRKSTTPHRREAQWPIGYGIGLRIKQSSVQIRPWPLR